MFVCGSDQASVCREKRLAELKEKQAKEKYGRVEQLKQPEFVKEVSQAGDGVWVVLLLFINRYVSCMLTTTHFCCSLLLSKPECQLLERCLDRLASKFRAVKFVKMISTECIPNFPDRNTPTLLLYQNVGFVTYCCLLLFLRVYSLVVDCRAM